MPPTSSKESARTAVASAADSDDTAASQPPPVEQHAILAQLSRVPHPASRLGAALEQARRLHLPFGAPELADEQERLAAGGDPDACGIAGRLVQLLCGGRYELHWVIGTTLDDDGGLWLQLSNKMLVRSDVCSGEPVGIEEVEAWYLHKGAM